MSYIPDHDPTPLRLRLGHRAEILWQSPLEAIEAESLLPAVMSEASVARTDTAAESVAASETPPPTAPWSERLDRAVERTDERVERWVEDQQRRLLAGLDLMVAQLKERQKEEAAHLETWKASERERVERDLAHEESRFHERLMAELSAFEEQLALRLCEQEERLARWWKEAEKLTQQRFAELGLSVQGDTAEPPAE